MAWSDSAAKYLRGSTSCPRCERGPVGRGSCPYCGAILTGPVADELRAVSLEAADLLTRRQEIIGRLTTKAALAPPPVGVPVAVAAPASAAPSSAAPSAVVLPPPVGRPAGGAAPASSSQVSLQSVLAIAGAVLLAVAIVVFRFFNVDVDISVRRFVIAGATVVFLGSAWLLARAKLTFSAEAVGALAMVFVALDIWAISEVVPDGVSPWTFAALATLLASLLTLLIAVLVRLRTWLWLGLVGLVFVPAFFGYAVDGVWSATVGHLGSVGVAIVGFELARRFATRFASPLLADRVTMTLAAALFGTIVVFGLPALTGRLEQTPWFVGASRPARWLRGPGARPWVFSRRRRPASCRSRSTSTSSPGSSCSPRPPPPWPSWCSPMSRGRARCRAPRCGSVRSRSHSVPPCPRCSSG
jgi:hypothetical protein